MTDPIQEKAMAYLTGEQEKAMAYLKGELGENERRAFEEELARSSDLRAALEGSRELLEMMTAANEEAIVRLVNTMIHEAVRLRASDIHVIGERKGVVVYYRIDGQLRENVRLPKQHQQPVVDRWKLLAECNLRERRIPQDGRIFMTSEGNEYELRVNVMPTVQGERVTARILSRNNVLLGLDSLGLRTPQHEAVVRLSERPNGFVFTSGDTGSGKTTLMYSMLLSLNGPDREHVNILTVEDPVEYAISGLSQTSVDRKFGLTFSTALRSFLRCDPDVVMLSEMRDLESAEIATEIALTGHLVLSTLHVPTAAAVPQRLKDIGIVPFLVAHTMMGAIGQRVVRRVCQNCVAEYEPSPVALQEAGLKPADGPFRKGAGCDACLNRGFRGRIGLFEVLEVPDSLRPLIAGSGPVETIWRETFGKQGGDLWEDAREKVKQGVITVEDAARALVDYPKFRD